MHKTSIVEVELGAQHPQEAKHSQHTDKLSSSQQAARHDKNEKGDDL